MNGVRWSFSGLSILAGGYLMFDAWYLQPVREASSTQPLLGTAMAFLGLAVLLYRIKDVCLEMLTLAMLFAAGHFIFIAIIAAGVPGGGRVLTPLAAGFLALGFVLVVIGATVGHAFLGVGSWSFIAAFWSWQIGLVIGGIRDIRADDVPSALVSFWVLVAVTQLRTAFLEPGRKAAIGFLVIGLIHASSFGLQARSTADWVQGAALSILCLIAAWGLRRPQPPGVEVVMAYLMSDDGVRR